MKSLTFCMFLLMCSSYTRAQNQWYAVLVGDTVELRVTGAHGDLQWQESNDSLIWSDISGLTDSIVTFVAVSSPTGKKFYRPKISNLAICNPSPWYGSIIRQRVINSTTQVQIGDWFHGGIVFYTDGTGHGLIAPQTNQSTSVQWGCYGTSISGATSLTDGNSNTTAIYNNCADRPIAASVCYDLTLNGYNDWFLPAKDQLNYLYQQCALVGGFANNYYWSSSEYNANVAWLQNFGNGFQVHVSKSYNLYVRCVRPF